MLFSISKVFEKHFCNQLILTNKTNILHSRQSGFRKGHSCQTALLHIVNKWATELDKGNMVGTFFLDLSKAFDFVNHDLLLKKLAVYHFSQHSIERFKSYLRNRKQLVQIDNVRSSFEVIKTGLPQGSQLGPLMFLLFINDLPLYLHHSSTDMYANDSTLYTSDISVSNLETILRKDLNRVLEWCYINKMNLNAQKTKCMLVVPSNKLSKFRDLNCGLC